MGKEKQPFGQYMTPSVITDYMVSLITKPYSSLILEPACGNGQFLLSLAKKGFTNINAYEIDKTIINTNFNVLNQSFVNCDEKNKYDVIIGNPPYIRWKNLEQNLKDELEINELWKSNCNSLCDYSTIFILKSIQLLKDKGELIFITPEYWLSTTHAKKIRNFILQNGAISQIIHFNETHIFKNVSGSFIIFKFIKNGDKNQKINITKVLNKNKISAKDISDINSKTNCIYFELPQFKENDSWILANLNTQIQILNFEKKCTLANKSTYESLGNYCRIANGMVSGFDKAFNLGNKIDFTQLNSAEKKSIIQVIKAKDINPFYYKNTTDYIFINDDLSDENSFEEFKHNYPFFANHLKPFLTKLKKRYDYHQSLPFWKWAFLRNYNLFKSSQCKIFVPCKERITSKNHLRFCLATEEIFPTQDVSAIYKNPDVQEDLLYILAFLNSSDVFEWFKIKGIRKGDILEFSERPLSSIPFRKIDFSNKDEVEIHNKIVKYTKDFIKTKNKMNQDEIQNLIKSLLK